MAPSRTSPTYAADPAEPLVPDSGGDSADQDPDQAAQPASPDDTLQMLVEQMSEHAQSKVESNSRLPVKIFATIVSNTFYNIGEASWIDDPDIVRASRPPLPSGSFSSSLRQSRVGAIASGPSIGSMQASGLISMDFYGGLANFRTGQVMPIPRLLYAYMRLDGRRTAFEIGQDQMVFAPRNPTSLAALYFPEFYRTGNLYLRVPQIRVEQTLAEGGLGKWVATGGLMAPVANDFVFDSPVLFSPNLAGERSRVPTVQARLSWQKEVGGANLEVAFSGHEAREQVQAHRESSRAGAFDFSLRGERAALEGEWFLGRNIGALGGALGQLAAKSHGGFLEGRIKASERIDFNAGFGVDRLIELRRFPASLVANSSIFGNVMYQLMPELVFSFQYKWLSTRPNVGDARRNHHFNVAFAYSF
jgi:hypothetical protein